MLSHDIPPLSGMASRHLNCLQRHDWPEDVARLVFEVAARDDAKYALRVLSFVCKRVQRWIDRIVYSTVILTSKEQAVLFASSIQSKGAPFFRSTVRSLALPGSARWIDSSILTIVTTCTGVTSLYWDLVSELEEHRSSILEAIESLPLHTLYIRINYFMDFSDPYRKPIKLPPGLKCLGIMNNWTTWHSLIVGDPPPSLIIGDSQPMVRPSDLARLRYLVLRVGIPPARASLFNDVMDACKKLKVCMAYVSHYDHEPAIVYRNRRGIGSCRDLRLVVVEQDLTRGVWERQLLDGQGDLQTGQDTVKSRWRLLENGRSYV